MDNHRATNSAPTLVESAARECYRRRAANLCRGFASCLKTKLSRLFASSSPARRAPRRLKPDRSFNPKAAVHSLVGFVATRCTHGREVTTMQIGGLYAGRGIERHGLGRPLRSSKIRRSGPGINPDPDRNRCSLEIAIYAHRVGATPVPVGPLTQY